MSKLHFDYKNEFLEFQREKIKNNTEKTVYEILEDYMLPMIEANHPRFKQIIKNIKYNRCHSNKDWIAAVLSEAGAIEYSSCTRLKNQDRRPRKSAIISICIVIGMDIEWSNQLLRAAGHSLRAGNKLDNLYSYLIIKSSTDTLIIDEDRTIIDVCNDIMVDIYGDVKSMDRLGPIPKEK